MIWCWVLVSETTTLRELHGILQVAISWEGIHLFAFSLHAAEYGVQPNKGTKSSTRLVVYDDKSEPSQFANTLRREVAIKG